MMLTSLHLVKDTGPECMLSFQLLSIHAQHYEGNTVLTLIMVHQHNFVMAWTSVFWVDKLNFNDDDGGCDYYYYCYCYYMQSSLVSREDLPVLEQWPVLPVLSRGEDAYSAFCFHVQERAKST